MTPEDEEFERIEREAKMNNSINWQTVTIPLEKMARLSVSDWSPKCNMVFSKNGETVCTLDWSGPKMTFTGEIEESAKVFFEYLASVFVRRLAEERAAEREACAKVCEDLVPTYLKDGERWLKGRNGKPDSRIKDLAPNLEEAWEAEQLLKHGSVVQQITEAHICANAIRARLGDQK